MKEEIYDIKGVMNRLGIGKDVALRLVQSGELKAKKVGQRKWRILESHIYEYLGKTKTDSR